MARILMPQLGETVTEGTVTRWLKSVGDTVHLDEPLVEVSTDKVDTEIPSAVEGTIHRLVVGEGDTVPIGALLALVQTGDEALDAHDEHLEVIGEEHESGDRVDRRRVVRSGLAFGGGSTQQPYHAPVSTNGGAATAPGGSRSGRATATTSPPARDVMAPTAPIDHRNVRERIAFTTIRRLTATHLTSSIQTAAHTLTSVEVDFAGVEIVRDAVRSTWRQREGFALSYLPFVARATCGALAEYPQLNAAVDGDALAVFAAVNLGVAVDLDHEGLIVPVIRSAESLRVAQLARSLHTAAVAAREHRLDGDDIAGGTFTITNAGGFGTLLSVPIINQPQVAILSTDGVSAKPVAVALPEGGHGVAVHPVGNLALSFDHRAVDGAYASAFLASVRNRLETTDWTQELAGTWQ